MKKKLAFAGIGLAALIVAGMAYVGQLDNKMAIAKVAGERAAAWNASLRTVDYTGAGDTETILDEPGYLARLQKIDTSGCPLPFRESFLSYEQTFQRRNQEGGMSRISVGMAKLAHVIGETQGKDIAAAETAADDYQSAWLTVQATALRYGVTISN